ncbi:hypothetical protein PMAYCL1PPCAC_16881, partial [Pristionchus mayeri]
SLHENICRHHLSSYSKIAIAYSVPLAFYILGWFVFLPNLVPTGDILENMTESISRLHEINISQFRVYGFPFNDNTRYSAFNAMFFYLLPTYMASYALLAICTVKIRDRLLHHGSSISTKTAQMQRQFWRTHIAQVLV